VVDTTISYASAQHKIVSLMDEAVKKRLVSDVPLGAFLSGGIDSSVVVALASRYVNQLETFSVGFRDEPFFDETYYANLVAKKFYTKHTVFSLSNNDMFQVLFDAMDYIDEPFADSSALAVYLLSKQTRKHVTVALSGDGADEMFAGYHKHMAHFRAVNRPLTNLAIKAVSPVFEHVPQSRNSIMSNLARQLTRYAGGLKLNDRERYWRWCSFASENVARQLLAVEVQEDLYNDRKSKILEHMDSGTGLNNVLLSDMNLVLLNDMLVKVDLMSMANSLEIRSPFLDREVVDFAFSLPHDFKIHGGMKKRLLQDAFRHMLPDELYKRPKKGFEVPLLKWLRNELDPVVKDYLLNSQFIKQQDIFNQQAINLLYNQLHSTSPGEAHARVWALLVFQHWYQQFKS
jgi:asparagine synthase (glutamine-hydrolysing)